MRTWCILDDQNPKSHLIGTLTKIDAGHPVNQIEEPMQRQGIA